MTYVEILLRRKIRKQRYFITSLSKTIYKEFFYYIELTRRVHEDIQKSTYFYQSKLHVVLSLLLPVITLGLHGHFIHHMLHVAFLPPK